MKKAAVAVAVVVAVGVIAARLLDLELPRASRSAAAKAPEALPLNLDRFVASQPGLRASLNEPPPLPDSNEARGVKPPAGNPPKAKQGKTEQTEAGSNSAATSGQAPVTQEGSSSDDSAKDREAKRAVLAMVAQAESLLQQGKRWEARATLSRGFFDADKQLAALIKPQLDTLSQELVFSPTPTPDSVVHTVQTGESLIRIARKYGTTHGLLMRINRKKSDRIRVDEKLKVLTGEVGVLVDKSDLVLTLLMSNTYVKQYPVCVGQDNATPTGTFVVKVRQMNPTWYPPEGGKFPFGHPKNVLGTRWMGFASKPGYSGYGIHGTTDPGTVPGRKSMGCVRMLNADAEEVFDFVTEGTKVEIRE